MPGQKDIAIAKKIIWMRLCQLIVNEKYKAGLFKIPLHIAMGHEAIAAAVGAVMQNADYLACTHRNMHYNLARANSFKPILDEYLLKPDGLAEAELGSMNLANPARWLVYSSSILGNDLPVATGLALAQKVKGYPGVVFVATGDGAMEEGAFYESVLFMKSNALAAIIVVENNDWSMHTKISERRTPIDLAKFAAALGAKYAALNGNDIYAYIEKLIALRKEALAEKTPIILDVNLVTLGGWNVKNADGSDRYIHPHSGPIPQTNLMEWAELEHSDNDPLFALTKHFPAETLQAASRELLATIKKEIDEA